MSRISLRDVRTSLRPNTARHCRPFDPPPQIADVVVLTGTQNVDSPITTPKSLLIQFLEVCYDLSDEVNLLGNSW